MRISRRQIARIAAAGAALAIVRVLTRRGRHSDPKACRLQSVWTHVAGCRIHARASAGRADATSSPVVLVHGFGVSSSYFVPAAERLSCEFEVYAPDLPGHGRSDTPRQPLDVPTLAEALIRWMDAVGLQRVSLVANSMGCQIAAETAVRYPERIERLVLIGPTVDPAARSVLGHARRLFVAGLYERLSLSGLLAKDYLRMGVRIIPELRFMFRNRIEENLPRIEAPVMLVRGENDPIAPQQWVEAAARLARAERTVVIPTWGHAVHFSAADQIVDAIAPFLRRATGPAG